MHEQRARLTEAKRLQRSLKLREHWRFQFERRHPRMQLSRTIAS
jgi:hypothetical protein